MNKKTILTLFIFVLSSTVVVYQNCAEVGGESPFANLSSQVDCSETPYADDCMNGGNNGNVDDLAVTVEVEEVSNNASTVDITGTCSGGGFATNKIRWTLNLKSRAAGIPAGGLKVDGDDLPPLRCTNGSYNLQIENSNTPPWFAFEANDVLTLAVQIFGYDNAGTPHFVNSAASYKPNNDMDVLSIVVQPKLAANWDDDNGKAPLVFRANANTQTLPPVNGTCEVKAGATTVRALLQDAKDPAAVPIVLGSAQCTPAGGTPPYDGTFSVNALPPVFNDGQTTGGITGARHYLVWADQQDNGVFPKSIQRNFQVRFEDGNLRPGGGGWTTAMAHEALNMFKRFITRDAKAVATYQEAVTYVARVGEIQDNAGNGCRTTNARFGIRCQLLEMMGVPERPDGGGNYVLDAVYNEGFAKTLHDVAFNGRNNANTHCDLSLNSTKYNENGFRKLGGGYVNFIDDSRIDGTKNRKIENIALCAAYWQNRMAGRSGSSHEKALQYGLRFQDVATCRNAGNPPCKCYAADANNQTMGNAGCRTYLRAYDRTMAQFFGSNGEGVFNFGAPDAKADLFYAGVIQQQVNSVNSKICSATTRKSVQETLVQSVVGQETTNLISYYINEQPGWDPTFGEFTVYQDRNDTCGSSPNASIVTLDYGNPPQGGGGGLGPPDRPTGP